jgi:hypothetical protein
VATDLDQRSIPQAAESRIVLGHWPILFAMSMTAFAALPLVGLLSSNSDPRQMSILRHAAVAMVPTVALLGLSLLAAMYVPKRWVRQVAMWFALAGIIVVQVQLSGSF